MPSSQKTRRLARTGALAVALALALGVAWGPSPARADEVPEEPAVTEAVQQTEDAATEAESAVPAEPAGAADEADTTPEVPEAVPAPNAGEPGTEAPSPEAEPADGEAEAAEPPAPVSPEADETPDATPEPAPEPDALTTEVDEATDDVALESQATDGLPSAPAGASADAVTNGKTYVIQCLVTTNRVARTAKAKAGTNAVIAPYTGKDGQKWVVRRQGGSLWYRLLLAGSGGKLALGVRGSNVCVVKNPTGKAGLLDVLWAFVSAGDDTYQLVNARTRKALGVAKKRSRTSLRAYAQNAAQPNNQRFRMVPANPAAPKSTKGMGGAYTILLSINKSLAAGVRKASKKAGASIVLQTASGSKSQQVYLQSDGHGYYIVWVVGTGKVLDVKRNTILPGNNILQRSYKGTNTQKWSVVATKNADGTYAARLQNRATGLVLGSTGAANGCNVLGLTKTSSYPHALTLRRGELISAGINVITPLATNARSLTVPGSATGTSALELYSSKGTLNQRFELQSVGRNLWRIRTASSGGWITWAGGTKVRQMGSSKTAVSRENTWKAVWKKGGVVLVNRASNRALQMKRGKTKNGTEIVAAKVTGKSAQHFVYTPTTLFKDGVYYVNSRFSKRRLVAEGNSVAPANIINHKRSSSVNNSEKFSFARVGGAYRITNVKSGLALTGGGPADAGGFANVSQKRVTGANDQLWKVQIGDGGYLEFVNVASGNYLVSRTNDATVDGVWAAYNVVERKASEKDKFQKGVCWKLSSTSGTVRSNPVSGTTVLLVGNSFTFYNQMYDMLQEELGADAYVDHATSGGKSLRQHLDTDDADSENRALATKTLKKLYTGDWDYVVIQELSTYPIDLFDEYLTSLVTFKDLSQQVGATPILYATWAFEGTIKQNADGSYDTSPNSVRARGTLQRTVVGQVDDPDFVYTLDDMTRDLQDAFARAAEATGLAVANAGQAFADKNYRKSLYHNDDKHPSATGSRLIAGVIADVIKSYTV